MYYLRLLDGLSVEGPSGPLSGRAVQRRQLALLALLGAAGETGLSRDRLIGHLWPESDAARARHLLRDSLYHIRRELGEDAVLTSGEAVRLNPEAVWCDVGAFRSALERGALEEAVGHYRGPFLNGFHARDVAEYERWADTERQRLGARYEEALESLAQAAEEAGDYPQAVGWWRRLCGHDRYNTRFVVSLMEALAAAGDPANALQAAAEHERVLREELGEGAASEFRALAEQFKQVGFPPRVGLSAPETAGARANRVAGGRVEAEPGIPESTTAPREPMWRPGAVAVAAIALILAVGGIIALASARRESQLNSPDATKSTSVAVLPFVEASGDRENDWFSDGLTAELINTLASVPGLRVTPRASAFTFKAQPFDPQEIARELGVRAAMTGTLARRGDELLVSVELVDLQTNSQLWGARYTRSVEDVFEIEEEIVRSIVAALGVPLTDAAAARLGRRPTQNPEAYDYYLRGNEATGGFVAEMIRFQSYERAIELDPGFAAAYARLSEHHSGMYWFHRDRSDERRAKARAAAEMALRLEPEAHDGYLALGIYHYWCELDYDSSLAQLAIAQRLQPQSSRVLAAIAFVQRRQGEFELAAENFRKALELDPRSDEIVEHLAETYGRLLRRYAEAEQLYDRAIFLNPADLRRNAFKAWLHLASEGNTAKAREALEAAWELVVEVSDDPFVVPTWIRVDVIDADYADALERLGSVPSDVFSSQFFLVTKTQLYAQVHELMGNADGARAYYDSARVLLEARLVEDSLDSRLHSALGLVYAGLGLEDAAVREGGLAVDLLPVSKDAWRGLWRVEDLARIYVRVGEHDLAMDQLEFLLSRPGELSVALLRIDPGWDPLRDHPRFQALLAKYQ